MLGRGAVAVTGGTSGIGMAIARALALEGRPVAIIGRSRERCAAAAKQLDGIGSAPVIGVAADVADEREMADAIDRIEERLGATDGLVTAAGVLARGGLIDLPLADFRRAWDVNVMGTWLAIRAVAPAMAERGFGRIVTIASVLATVGMPERAAYAATKGAVVAMTRSIAVEFATSGVTVNCIAPGPVATAMSEPATNVTAAAFTDAIPMGRWGTGEDIAHMSLPLLSADAGFTTGSVIHVDGGYTSR